MDHINITVLTRDYPVGLACTKRVHQLIKYLSRQGAMITVISYRSTFEQPQQKGEFENIDFINLGRTVRLKPSHLLKIIPYFFSGLKTISKLKDRTRTNILYCTGSISIENLPFILWAKAKGYNIVFAIEEDFSHFDDKIKFISRFKYWTISKLDSLTCRTASALVVISSYLYKKYSNKAVKNIILLPITANLNNESNKSVFNDPPEILYAGTFGDKDGVGFLIDGFRMLRAGGTNAKLVLIGQSAQQKLYKEKYAEASDIIFKGYVPDESFYPMLRHADILCMCRTGSGFANAGFPFKLGEYLATGNPVISTRVSDVEYYLSDEDAFLIGSDNAAEIAEALKKAISNPSEALLKGRNGLNKCKEHFSAEKNGRMLMDLILKIAGNKAA